MYYLGLLSKKKSKADGKNKVPQGTILASIIQDLLQQVIDTLGTYRSFW